MPTYRVTIGGETFEVASDKDLSDTEVYQYAKQQVGHPPAIPPPTDPPASALDRVLGFLGNTPPGFLIGQAYQHPVEAGAMVGGAAAVPLTGGASVPAALAAAGLGGAGGAGLGLIGAAAKGDPGTPTTATGVAQTMATQGALQAGSEGIGQAVSAALPAAAKAVYRGYLKPSLSQRMLPKADTIVQTALDEALPISRGGVQTANAVIGELRTEVDRILAQTPGTVDLHQVADKVRAFAKQRYFKPGVDTTDYQMALGVAEKLDAHPSLGLPPGARPTRVDVSLPDANEAKRGLYTSIKEAGFGTPQGAKKTTEKFAAHEVKTSLEGAAPAIGSLNARESKLIDAARTISKAVEREANQNQLYGVKSLTSGMLGTSGYALGVGGPTAAAGALVARGALHPAVASRAAILANRFAAELGVGSATATRLANYIVSEEQGANEQNQHP